MTDSEGIMTRYLLGELSEPERAALEQEYFSDPQLFDQLVQTENDLIDDYVRGRLSSPLRERFEQCCVTDPKRRVRLRFAEALATRLDAIEESSSAAAVAPRPVHDALARHSLWAQMIARLRNARPMPAFATALVVLFVAAGVWYFINTTRLRRELREAEDARVRAEQRELALRQGIDSERTRSEQLASELGRLQSEQQNARPNQTPPNQPLPAFASLILTVGGARGAHTGPPATLVIPTRTMTVRIQLNLTDNDYPSYAAVLQTADGEQLFKREGLQSRSQARPHLVVIVPANRFANGDYILTLKGVRQKGEVEDVSKLLFRVEKK
jgi:hypothetical protein